MTAENIGIRPAGPTTAEEPVDRGAGLRLLVLLGAQFLIALDFSILNVALPAIQTGLGFSPQNLQWVVTLFALSSAGFALLFGRLGDVVGRREMFLGGIALLTVASLVGGLAGSPAILLSARVGQGLATAMVAPSAMALLTTSFPEGRLRERALGLSGALLSAGFTVGAILGGVLTGLLNWRWAFLINLPICLAVLVVAPRLLPHRERVRHTSLDAGGAITVTVALLTLIYGVTKSVNSGWSSPVVIGSLVIALAALGLFLVIELRASNPLVPLRILRRPNIKWGNFGGVITFTMFSSVIFLMTLYLQHVLGLSPLVTGLAFGVQGVIAFVAGMTAARIIAWLGGSGRSLVLGLLVQAAATGVLVLLGTDRKWFWLVVVATSIGAFGHVLSVVSFMVTTTSGNSNEEQGMVTALTTLTQQISITLGIPVLSAIAAARANSLSIPATSARAVLSGTTTAIGLDAVIVLIGAVLILLFLRSVRRPEAQPAG